MSIDAGKMISAYQNTLNTDLKSKPLETNEAKGSFSDFLTESTKDVVGTLQKAEQVSMKAVAGEADINEVVTAVTEAELALNTVVSVRDRVIQAYQEILRMPV